MKHKVKYPLPGKRYVQESLGFSYDEFERLREHIYQHLRAVDYADIPIAFFQSLDSYSSSWSPKTPNDYIVIGLAYSDALEWRTRGVRPL